MTWPDATTLLAGWLTDEQDVPVRWTVPNPRPDEFVVVRRSGTESDSLDLDAARFDIEVWSGSPGDSPVACHTLANSIRDLIHAMPTGSDPVVRARCTGPVWLPDGESGSPRVVMAATVTIART